LPSSPIEESRAAVIFLRVSQVGLAWPRSIRERGGGRYAGVAGDGFLGCAALLAELADGLAEGGLRSL
jgi:hypothetical protein